MERIVERVVFKSLPKDNRKRVAAYARVSSGKDAMLHSLSAQVSYYSSLIQKRPDWVFCGVYADEALTGTKANRENFQRLLADCKNGKIDMIITKSISRFARNTLTLIQTVRELKTLGVDVFFEEQNIHTLSANGELILTFLASFAQEESLSVSKNQKWRVKKNFEEGLPWNTTMLGYRNNNGCLEIETSEAQAVRYIFDAFLNGKGLNAIAKELNIRGVPTRQGNSWGKSSVRRVLQNYTYTGNLLLQTTYVENHLTKRKKLNLGKLPKYHIQNSHEGIITMEDFTKVQKELDFRADTFCTKGKDKKLYPLSGYVFCNNCGDIYRRKTKASRVVYICETYNSKGKAACPSKAIPEETLINLVAEVIGCENITSEDIKTKIEKILICDDYKVVFKMLNGSEYEKQWIPLSRKNSWSPEMKEEARQREMKRQGRDIFE